MTMRFATSRGSLTAYRGSFSLLNRGSTLPLTIPSHDQRNRPANFGASSDTLFRLSWNGSEMEPLLGIAVYRHRVQCAVEDMGPSRCVVLLPSGWTLPYGFISEA
jgi:hypothetical protein